MRERIVGGKAESERAGLAGQYIFDDQVHFVRDDYQYEGLLDIGRFAAEHWNPAMLQEQGIEIGRSNAAYGYVRPRNVV